MDKPAAPRRPLAALVAVALVAAVFVAACGSSAGPVWTYGPAAPPPVGSAAAAPSVSAAGGSPAPASASPGDSGAPSPSPSSSPSSSAGGGSATYRLVGWAPCPDSRFECVTLSVPRDHRTAGGPSWDVTFGIQRAKGTRLGTFVTITGGPGSSGLASADSYTDAFDSAITDHYDIVFLDQRGVGRSHPIGCPTATGVYYSSTTDPGDPAQRAAVGAAASGYVADCLKEAHADPAELPYYATGQAVEDLEAFRQYLGVDKIDLYGESYGSQYVQTYAAAHPDHVAALFVDGPVDLAIDGIPYYVEAARAFDDALAATLADCRAHPSCRADTVGGDPAAAYAALQKQLDGGPLTFRFPTATGTFVDRQLTRTDLENAAVNYLYSPFSRFLLDRALTAASHDDYVPLARLAYDSIVLDPETLVAIPDPTYSDAMYYAVECQDYAYYLDRGSPTARLGAWLDDGARLGMNELHLGATFYGDLPCLYWPAQPTSAARPAPITAPPYPTFVMTATLDTAVPIANAMRIFARLQDAYFIEAIGGAHVIFGRGDACPDQLITDFLANGTRPAARVTSCPNAVADDYVANARPKATDYRDALALMSSMDDQITSTDDYNYRLDKEPITMGCDFGGTLRYGPVTGGTQLTLRACAFTQGAALTGTGRIDDDAGTLSLSVTLPGGQLRYLRDADGVRSVGGRYQGRPVSLKR